MALKTLDTNMIEFVKENYDKMPYKDIAEKFGVKTKCINYIIEKRLKLVNAHRKRTFDSRKIIANDGFFETPSADWAYILGFLVADGHIAKDRPRIHIGLARKDVEHLKKIRDILSPDSIVREFCSGGFDKCELQITSRQMYDDLCKLGFRHQKSGFEPLLLNIVPQQFKYDYLRGIIDGDGCISCFTRNRKINNRNYLCKDSKLSITSAGFKFLQDIQNNLCFGYGNMFQIKNYFIYQISNRKSIIKIGALMYNNNNLRLDRKYRKFLLIKEFDND